MPAQPAAAAQNPTRTHDAAALLAQRAEWEEQALYDHEEQQRAWEEGEYEQMMMEVEGY